MLNLNAEGIKNREAWEKAGYELPTFDFDKVKAETKKNPRWIHFGAGNIFRAFQAHAMQKLLNEGACESGLIVAEGFDTEIIDAMYKPHDNLGVLVTLKADGKVDKTVIGSIMEALKADPKEAEDWDRMLEIFASDSLQMVSFTITEKGYSLVGPDGALTKAVEADFAEGPKAPVSYIGKVAALLYHRFESGRKPVAMVSMDNCSHNGDKLYAAINRFAHAWEEAGLVKEGFVAYVEDPSYVSFPWTMIDKITPRPDEGVRKILTEDGLVGTESVVTGKNTYVASFVNAEECEYLVIEDKFPNGRFDLSKAGIYYTTRETVDRVERMKVCTCLNPLHTALAVFGCLLSYTKISEEMKDADLKKLVERIGYEEGLPVVTNPGIINPEDFISEVLTKRIPNPFMPDTPQRIATDTSQKVGIRYGETVKAYLASEKLNIKNLKLIPLVYAAWVRYLMGVNDLGETFELSSDPMLTALCPIAKRLTLGSLDNVSEVAHEIFERKDIFAVNLYEAGLGSVAESYLKEMLAGKGAIRATLHKYV